MSVRILAIDPGSRKTGFAIIEVKGKKFTYIDSGVIDFYQGKEFLERLGDIHRMTQELVVKYQPDEVAIESLIYVKSHTALIKLSQARGAMLGALVDALPGKIYEYSPNLIKQMSTGHGHATKERMQKSLQLVFGVREFSGHDESDALAVALCHGLQRSSAQQTIAKKGRSRALSSQLKHAVGEIS